MLFITTRVERDRPMRDVSSAGRILLTFSTPWWIRNCHVSYHGSVSVTNDTPLYSTKQMQLFSCRHYQGYTFMYNCLSLSLVKTY